MGPSRSEGGHRSTWRQCADLPGKADIAESAGRFEPAKFEDQYEIDLVDLINQKRAGKPITVKERPLGY